MSASSKIIQAAAGNVAGGAVGPVGIDFEGGESTDWLSRSSDLTGNSDGKTMTLSYWSYEVSGSGTLPIIYGYDGGGVRVLFRALEVGDVSQHNIRLANSSSVYQLNVSLPYTPRDQWNHFLISVDLTNTSNRHVYINGVNETPSSTWSTYTNGTVDFTFNSWAIGGDVDGNPTMHGRLAGVYMDYTYRDLSVEANRSDFIDENGLYVKPPTSGIISVPLDDVDDPGRNDGTGGDFTLNGIVAQSGRGPNQYNAVASNFDGSADYLLNQASNQSASNVFTLSMILNVEANGRPLHFDRTSTTGLDPVIDISSNSNYHEITFRPLNESVGVRCRADTGSFNRWVHFAVSFDITDSASFRMAVNGVEDNTFVTFVQNATIAVSSITKWMIGKGAGYFDGSIGEVYFDTAYIDLSTDNPFWDSEAGKPKPVRQVLEETGNTPLIAMPIGAEYAGNNLGTIGNFSENSGPYVGARGASEYIARSVYFNGTVTNNLSNTSSGIANTKAITLVLGLRPDAGANCFSIGDGTNVRFLLDIGSTRSDVLAYNSSGVAVLDADINIGYGGFTGGVYLISFDLTNASNRHISLNGGGTETYSTYTNDFIDTASKEIMVGARTNGTNGTTGDVSFVYFTTEYVDFTQESTRNLFVDQLGYPRNLTPEIEASNIPTPLVYLTFDDPSDLGNNLGTGGDFTINGTVPSGADFDPS